jgi:hypothetical protein
MWFRRQNEKDFHLGYLRKTEKSSNKNHVLTPRLPRKKQFWSSERQIAALENKAMKQTTALDSARQIQRVHDRADTATKPKQAIPSEKKLANQDASKYKI